VEGLPGGVDRYLAARGELDRQVGDRAAQPVDT
jgi:hypothetical protein